MVSQRVQGVILVMVFLVFFLALLLMVFSASSAQTTPEIVPVMQITPSHPALD
jgi:hypothetical protein